MDMCALGKKVGEIEPWSSRHTHTHTYMIPFSFIAQLKRILAMLFSTISPSLSLTFSISNIIISLQTINILFLRRKVAAKVVVFVVVFDCDGERANNLSGHEP